MVLYHSFVRANEQDQPREWVVFLHGILGSGANLRPFAKRVVSEFPSIGCVLVDLRMHGQSQNCSPPHTIAQAGQDIVELQTVIPGRVKTVVGHSFGGKVALEFARRCEGSLEQVWIWDSVPGVRLMSPTEAISPDSPAGIIDLLQSIGPRFDRREDFADKLQWAGLSNAVIQWLGMNLKRVDDGYVFGLNLQAIRDLLSDYFVTDYWPVIERPVGKTSFHSVIGGRSIVYRPEDKTRMTTAESNNPGRVFMHSLPSAGHWVHVDDPVGLWQLFQSHA